MKCKECGNELLTGDRYWQMGLCNECWSAYRFFDKPIPLDNPYEKRIEELQKQLAENDKELAELRKEFKSLQEFNRNTNMQLKNYKSKLYGVDDIRKLREMHLTPEEKKLYIKGFEMCERQIATNIADLTLKIRHQVCEDIRMLVEPLDILRDEQSCAGKYLFERILDQIEKGE